MSSAHLDANARMEAAKAIRRTMESNEKAAMVIDHHDTYFLDIVSDSVLVFQGEEGIMERPSALYPPKGNELFLSDADVTFRRDIESHRPRINKPSSRKDREQKSSGEYFYSD